jgi:soluble lytic murein transglycosylase-like protein
LSGGRIRIWVVFGVLALVLVPAGGVGAQSPAQTQYESEDTSQVEPSRLPALEARVGEQDASLRREIGEISAVGAELEETQDRVDGARRRAQELREQKLELEREIKSQREDFRALMAGYEAKAQAAYRGDHLDGLASLLDGLLGAAGEEAGTGDPRVARILLDGREDLEAYRESRRILRNTMRQISQKERDYEKAVAEERASSEELRRRERELDESIAGMSRRNARTEARLQELRAEERARLLEARPATGGGGVDRAYELGIARDSIVASPVEEMPRKEYMKLYRESARKYGFGEDWYILAAVGQVESNHGENMGPSSAGAMGPMQFLPSTWEGSGVDGNGDGAANIMDPEDAIPAAAGYLREGGAPRDWYRALYSYNHADWYVKKVLAVAEGYRRLAKDDEVGPYV